MLKRSPTSSDLLKVLDADHSFWPCDADHTMKKMVMMMKMMMMMMKMMIIRL
jgi:hypothetical protein